MVDPQFSLPAGQFPTPPPPLGDILNYSIDFHEIWYISSLTSSESIAITKIMVVPHPLGGYSKLLDRFL